MVRQINLYLEMPENCAYKNTVEAEITAKIHDFATLISLQFVCSREKMLAEIVFETEENLVLKAENLIYEVIQNHHPISEGKKVTIRMASINGYFRTIAFKRQKNRLIANVYAGKEGEHKKAHIFREPKREQRYEKSENHVLPADGFENLGEYYHMIQGKDDFQACVLVEVGNSR